MRSHLKYFIWVSSALMFASCTTEYNLATRQQESLMYSTEKEVKIGDRVAAAIEEQFTLVQDVDMNERAEGILKRIAAVSDRRDVVYIVRILDEDELNAISLPGGHIYLFKGLMERVENDDQLAGVIAHEVAHITARHAVKRMQASYGALLLQVLAVETGKGDVAGGINLALNTVFTEYSQQDEFESDRLGVKYMRKAGYDPQEMVAFLKILKEKEEKEPPRPKSYWRTHPNISQRIAVTNKEVQGKLEFKDYLNIIQADDPYAY